MFTLRSPESRHVTLILPSVDTGADAFYSLTRVTQHLG
jgi:hypothetical protein